MGHKPEHSNIKDTVRGKALNLKLTLEDDNSVLLSMESGILLRVHVRQLGLGSYNDPQCNFEFCLNGPNCIVIDSKILF